MSDINPVNSTPLPSNESPTPASTFPAAPPEAVFQGGGWGAFAKWLGPANYAQFRNNLCTQIVQQIGHDKEQQKKASDELKKSETGQN